jgi:hypothetical protein
MECALCKKREGTIPVTIYSANTSSHLMSLKREGNQLVSTTQTDYYDIRPHLFPVCSPCIRRRGYGSGRPRISLNLVLAALTIPALVAGGVWAIAKAFGSEKPGWLLLVPLAAFFVWMAVELYREYRVVDELRKHALADRRRSGEASSSTLQTLSEAQYKGLRRT